MGSDDLSRLLRIGVFVVLFTNFEEVSLSWRAGVFAPEAFDIDRADVTSSCGGGEGSVYLFEVGLCEYGVILVATDLIPDIFLAGLHCIVDAERVSLILIGQKL